MTKNDKKKAHSLTTRQLKAIPHLVASSTYEKGCRKARMSRNTFYEWLKNPAFKEELKSQRDTVIEQALEALKGSITNAVNVLIELLDTTDSESLKRLLANDIVGYVIKAKELEDFDKRLSVLESELARMKKTR